MKIKSKFDVLLINNLMKNFYNKMFSHTHHSKAIPSDKKANMMNKLIDHLVSTGVVRTPKVN